MFSYLTALLLCFYLIFPELSLALETKLTVLKPVGMKKSDVDPSDWDYFLQPINLNTPPIRVVGKEGTVAGNIYNIRGRVFAVKKFITAYGDAMDLFKEKKLLRLSMKPWVKKHLPPKQGKPARLLYLKAEIITWDEDKKLFKAEKNARLNLFPYIGGGQASSTPTLTITGEQIIAYMDVKEIISQGRARVKNARGFARGLILTYFDKENLVKLSGNIEQPAIAEKLIYNPSKAKIEKQRIKGEMILYDTSDESYYSE
ncbi:hypothetical protein ACFL35_03185 [Candidatus Riflebacteria bacterium]